MRNCVHIDSVWKDILTGNFAYVHNNAQNCVKDGYKKYMQEGLLWGDVFERLERWEKSCKFCCGSFSLLIVLQLLMTKEPIRFYLSFAEQMEGIPLSDQSLKVANSSWQDVGSVKVKICSHFVLPQVVVYVNGQEAANFQEREVSLSVRAGMR